MTGKQKMIQVAVVLLLSVLAMTRNEVWRGGEKTLWEDTVRKSPLKPRPYMALGVYHNSIGNYKLAIQDYSVAIQSASEKIRQGQDWAGSLDVMSAAQSNISVVLMHEGRYKEAEDILTATLRLNPGFPGASVNLGNLYIALKRYPEAITVIDQSLIIQKEYRPSSMPKMYQIKAISMALMGDCENAQPNFDMAASLDSKIPKINCTEVMN